MGGVLIWLPGSWALVAVRAMLPAAVGASLGNSLCVGIVCVSFTVASKATLTNSELKCVHLSKTVYSFQGLPFHLKLLCM